MRVPRTPQKRPRCPQGFPSAELAAKGESRQGPKSNHARPKSNHDRGLFLAPTWIRLWSSIWHPKASPGLPKSAQGAPRASQAPEDNATSSARMRFPSAFRLPLLLPLLLLETYTAEGCERCPVGHCDRVDEDVAITIVI